MRLSCGIMVFLLLSACGLSYGQTCGLPPGPFRYSDNFYKAEAKYLQTNSSTSASGAVKYGDLAINGDKKESDNVTDWQNLTIQQAHDLIVQEHASQAANIVAECGYRACLLQGGQVVSPAAQTLISEVCSPAIIPNASSTPTSPLTISPQNATVVFGGATQEQRTVTLTNNLPADIRVTWLVNPGAFGSPDIVNPHATKTIVIPAKRSRAVNVTLSTPGRSDMRSPVLTFQAAADATVNASTTFILIGNPRLLLPNPAIAAGQLYPNAKEQNDQDNPQPIYYASDPGPHEYPLAHPEMGPQMCNTSGGTDACGKATFRWAFSIPTTSSTHAAALMRMDANVGGTCGRAIASAPGGYGGVDPRWVTTMVLPGIPNQDKWHVRLTSDMLHTVTHASCKVTVGSMVYTVLNDNVSSVDISLEPNAYTVQLSCEGDNPYYGCKGAPGLTHYVDQHYQLSIDADRSTSNPHN